MAKKKKENIDKCCEYCENMIPIGEGDHICDAHPGKMVLSDYSPTEDYFCCGGRDFV